MGLFKLFSSIYAVFAVLSFVTFFIVWFIAKWRLNDTRKATVLAGDITNVFLIGAVAAQFDILFPNAAIGGIWLLILIYLIAAGLIGGAQSRLKGQINVKRLIRVIWRISFMFLSVLYILFAIIIFIKYLIQ